VLSRISSVFAALAWTAVSASVVESVLEDEPSRLRFQVEVPEYRVAPGYGGQQVEANGLSGAGISGAPDLPWYRFQVAAGAKTPQVTIEAQEWVEMDLAEGLAGLPRWITPRRPENFRDPALFAAGGKVTPVTSAPGSYRGISLRNVGIPLGEVRENGKRVRMLKRFIVRVDFGPAGPANPAARSWLRIAGAKNTRGGQYHAAFRRPPMRKEARTRFALGESWLKIRVGDRQLDGFAEDGVYALRFETALAANRDVVGARVESLRLYAGPQDTLRTSMDTLGPLAPTLREIPIAVEDVKGDGTFDEGDRILFYGHGTSVWKPVAESESAPREPAQWRFESDLYSFDNHYYLDWSGSGGGAARLAETALSAPPGPEATVAPHYVRAEKDLGTGSCDPSARFDDETGYAWYWFFEGSDCRGPKEITLSSSQLRSPTTDTLEGYAGDTAWFGFFVFERGPSGAFIVHSAGSKLGQAGTEHAWYGTWFAQPNALPGGRSSLDSVRWSGGNNRFEGFTVLYSRRLDWQGKPRRVFPADVDRRVAYRIQGGAGIRCLRVEKGVGAKWLAVDTAGSDGIFVDSAGRGENVLYHLYRDPLTLAREALAEERRPTDEGVVQNLLTGDGLDPEYLIIAPAALLAEAVELRKYREEAGRILPLKTAVVRTEDIYREWSGGRLSPVAIRDGIRWAWQRWGSGSLPGRLRHVVLYGDGHYDYRNLRNASLRNPLPNHVPPFNWDDAINNNFANNPMSTDDFFAVLDGGEYWTNGLLDVSLGRLPIQSREEGQAYLDKVKLYEDPKSGGDWRGRITLTADDHIQRGAPNNLDQVPGHTNDSEELGGAALSRESGMRFDKIYELDYPFNASYLKPEATQDLLNSLNRGTLFVSYFGHGAFNQWSDEVLLQTNDALSRLRNSGKNFMVGVFSCTVGRFEKILDEGMCEQFVKQKEFGAISGLCGTRETYPSPNKDLGKLAVSRILHVENGQSPTLGDAVLFAKNSLDNGFQLNKQ
jgi:hypothetical protein